MAESLYYVAPEKIRRFTIDLFVRGGMRAEDAACVADHLIDADLRGVTTHGLTRIPLYFEKIDKGLCDPQARPEIIRAYGATALIDAHNCMGQVSGTMAMKLAIEKAGQYGIGYVGVRNGCHYGTAGYYAMMAERQGMIGLSTTNSGVFVAPYGGLEKRLGTNPVAVAIPAGRHLPILLDMATSRVSRGKLLVAMKKKAPVPPDWALDAEGRATTDAARAFAGILLPLSYKGYGMAVVIDMLAGVLSGSGFGAMVDTPEGAPLVGSNFMALKIDAFCDPEEFRRNVDALIDEILSVRREEETPRVYMPGEIEFEREAENMDRGGVPLQPFQLRELKELGARYGLALEAYLPLSPKEENEK